MEDQIQAMVLEEQLEASEETVVLAGTNSSYRLKKKSKFTEFVKKSAGDPDLDLGGDVYYLKEKIKMKPGEWDPKCDAEYATLQTLFGDKAALFKKRGAENMRAHYSDVNQGAIGNCWLMAAMQSVCRYGMAESMFVNLGDGPEPKAYVDVKLHKQDGDFGGFDSIFIQTVTTKIPANGGKPVYVSSDDEGEYWPCMAEKAVASAMGSYQDTSGGLPAIGLAQLIGGTPGFVQGVTSDATILINAWRALLRRGIAICVAWKEVPGGPAGTNGEPSSGSGLVSMHAYTVLALVSHDGHDLAYFRNPWGRNVNGCNRASSTNGAGEWTGKWSDCDAESWDANPQLAEMCGHKGVAADGNFWMCMTDVVKYLDGNYSIFIPKDPELLNLDLTTIPGEASPPPQGGSDACQDIPGWADSTGSTCDEYTSLGWCTLTGELGPNWKPDWGTFSRYTHEGKSAADACCGCGGGRGGSKPGPNSSEADTATTRTPGGNTDSNLPLYQKMEMRTNGCPSGYVEVTTEDECKKGSKTTRPKPIYGGTESECIYPKGCYIYTPACPSQAQNPRAFLNTPPDSCPQGRSQMLSAPLCKRR